MTEPGMHKDNEFAGKVALVTGAARNIGRAIALALASGGAQVAVNTRSNIEQAQAVVDEIKALGTDGEAYLADVAEPAQVQAMVDAVLKRFGRLDILVLNAAVREHVHFDEISFEDWRRVVGLTKALAHDLAEFGIRVNCISPGQIETSGKEKSPREIPLGRRGTPFEIAGMVRTLCGPAGAYMTGQTLHINGGLSNSGV